MTCFFIASLATKVFLGEESLSGSMCMVMASCSERDRLFHIRARVSSMRQGVSEDSRSSKKESEGDV